MKLERNDMGWSVQPDEMPISDMEIDQPTRIATIDSLGEKTVISAGSSSKNGENANRCGSHERKRSRMPIKRTAEFLPSCGKRATGEVTIQWSDGSRDPISVVKENAKRVGKTLRGRGRVVILVAVLALASTAAFASISRKKAANAAANRASAVAEQYMPNEKKTGGPTDEKPFSESGDERITNQSGAQNFNLRDAADALIDGRMQEALEVYRKLKASSPSNESYGLAVEILSQPGDGAKQ